MSSFSPEYWLINLSNFHISPDVGDSKFVHNFLDPSRPAGCDVDPLCRYLLTTDASSWELILLTTNEVSTNCITSQPTPHIPGEFQSAIDNIWRKLKKSLLEIIDFSNTYTWNASKFKLKWRRRMWNSSAKNKLQIWSRRGSGEWWVFLDSRIALELWPHAGQLFQRSLRIKDESADFGTTNMTLYDLISLIHPRNHIIVMS